MKLWKCCIQYASKSGKLISGHRAGKGQFSFQSQRKAISLGLPSKVMLKSSKVMLKILQARLQQYMNHELPDVQAGLEKAEEPEIKLSTSTGWSEKQEGSRKTSTFPYWLCQNLWLCVSQQTVRLYNKKLIKENKHLLTWIIHVYMGDNKEKNE